MNSRAIIFIGTFIGLLAFVAEFFGFDIIARPIFFLGLGLALIGVTLTIFFFPNEDQPNLKKIWFYRLSTLGFLMAAASIMLGNHLVQADWINNLFDVGAGMFVIFAILPMLFSSHDV